MIGKIVAGLIGLFSFGFIGALIGVFIGHYFDRGMSNLSGRFSPQQRAEIEQAFFATVFPLLGHIAKSDGRVSEDEIAGTEALMAKMSLTADARTQAIELFKKGTHEDFDLDVCIEEFLSVCGKFRDLKQILLVYQITLAYADGHLHSAEEQILERVAKALGYSRFAFNHLMGMVKAQAYFHQRGGAGGAYQEAGVRTDQLQQAYAALGVKDDISDAELKRAYRKLMSEYHPDKLAGRGVPEDMVHVATERAQEIQTAYDLIKKHRKGAS